MHHASPDTPRTLPEVMARSARLHADRPALGMAGGMPITYAQMAERVSAAAAFLMDHGVARGDRVAILAENTPAWGITYFAVTGLGAVAVPVMSEFSPVQVGHILEHSGSRAVLVSGRLREKLALAGGGAETLDIEEAAAAAFPPAPRHPGQPALQRPAAEDLAAIIYTSGTTGHSKGVMLSHRNIVSNALATLAVVSVRPEDRLLSILTLAHTYECTLGLVAALSTGASIFYLDRPPSATALIPALQKVRPTIVLSVPLVMEKIYRSRVRPELEKHALSRLPGVRGLITLLAGRKLRSTFGGRIRVFAIGGAALSPDVEDFLRAARFPYAIGYGLTETSPLVAGSAPGRTRRRAAGPALPDVQIRVVNGEVQVSGPNVMMGYYRDPERTREAFTGDGWLRTGDLGTLDARGRLAIRGRLKTMILGASGENIYPEEIEAVFNQSPYVDESLVYSDGAALAALVQLKPDVLASVTRGAAAQSAPQAAHPARALLERIRAEVNAQVAFFSRVQSVHLQAEPFEKTPTMKIKRFLYEGGAGR